MKRTHLFKNYEAEGMEEIYIIRVKVKDYRLTIELLDENMKAYEENIHVMDEVKNKLSEHEALNYIDLFMKCELELL